MAADREALATLNNIAQNIAQVATAFAGGIGSSVPSFTFATLPTAVGSAGKVVFCSNGRKPGQGPGAGTGMLAFSDGAGWFSTAGTALAA